MNYKGQHINLIVDLKGKVDQETIIDILHHIRNKFVFALLTPDDTEAMVYFPADLSAKHTNGQSFNYDSIENYIDSIKLTLIEYNVFVSYGQKLKNVKLRKPIQGG